MAMEKIDLDSLDLDVGMGLPGDTALGYGSPQMIVDADASDQDSAIPVVPEGYLDYGRAGVWPVPYTHRAHHDPALTGRVRYVDRSRVLAYQECQRLRFLEYEAHGTGIRLKAANIPLSTGVHSHAGLAELLTTRDVEKAVKVAVDEYYTTVKERGLELDYISDSYEFTLKEQASLTEALLRAYAMYQLPRLLEEFIVVEVESEDLLPLNETWRVDGVLVIWQARTDALLLEISSGDLYALSFKTAASWDRRNDSAAHHDMQGLSEPEAIKPRLERYMANPNDPSTPEWWRRRIWMYGTNDPELMGVKMEWLVKGIRMEWPKGSGRKVTSSPLIYGYRLRGLTPDMDQYKVKYTAARDWEKFPVWDDRNWTVKTWVDKLASEAPDELADKFVTPVPYGRGTIDAQEWRETVSHQECEEIPSRLDRAAEMEYDRYIMARTFRRETDSCDWPSSCPMIDICHGPVDWRMVLDQPDGKYVRRDPHHLAEKELFQIEGVRG